MSKIYEDLYDRVERMVRQFRIPQDDFQDIVQLVMMNIFDRRLDLQNIGSKLLFRLVRNTIVDRLRPILRNAKYLDRNLYFNAEGTVCDSQAEGREVYTPVAEIKNEEKLFDAIIECELLPRLSHLHEEVLELNLHGMNCKEIAKHLGISVGTAKSRLHYARKYNRANRR